ncbi:armadillo-type fold domain-containing [Trichoderma cornu-damae]|uniref:Armadillo-type fold domain-containing n=1 Tax=Trichoderma cornu-damae TaxID=654480 RepID=A0A9P8TTL2_9HYPO|nr:armadillo-type fold domain-containing [Trichoderma cornu-damae]
MGKSRKARGGHRNDPVAKPVKPPSDPELAALRESKILPIINDLKSADPKSRSAAASLISSIIQDTKCRKLLLREQIVFTVLTQTLTDSALESRAAGWGILQVLAQEEEADFCVHLFRQDVLTAIEFATKLIQDKILSSDAPFAKLPKAERGSISSIAASLVSLLTALAEASDEILEAISNNSSITNLLFTLITHDPQGDQDPLSDIRGDAMACLMILSEDNSDLAQKLTCTGGGSSTACYDALVSLKGDVNGDGILACAILHNVYGSLLGLKNISPQTDVADDADLIPTLTKAIAAFVPGQSVANGGSWSSPSEYQQLALETMASIGTGLGAELGGPVQPSSRRDPSRAAADKEEDGDENMEEAAASDADDNGDDEDGDDDGGDDEMNEDEMEADMDMVTGGDRGDENIDDLPTLKSLILIALPELIRLASLQPSDGLSLKIQAHALSALNNIAWSVSLVDLSDETNAGVRGAWTPVGRALWQQVISPALASDTADVDLATQITSLAWAVSRTLRGETPLQPNEHRRFISLYQATKGAPARVDPEDPFQALGVKCVGVLGQLALHPEPTDLNRDIGAFLVTLLAGLPDTPTADAVEAFNQIFDIYGNEEYAYDAAVFWKDGFLKHLEGTVSKAKAMAKSVNKSSQPELRDRADEVLMNLTRFLSYKKKHRPVEVTLRERS